VDALLSGNVFAGHSELVIVRDVPVATTCPHHLMPGTGLATVAFAPEEHLIGVGTVARVLDAFARRLALQEQIGERTVAALQKHLAPRWAACRITMSHACMTARGERAHGARVETLALAGGDVDEALVYTALGVGR
jgi:GTP cyclohydrolase I